MRKHPRRRSRIYSKPGPKTKKRFFCIWCKRRFWTKAEKDAHMKRCKKKPKW